MTKRKVNEWAMVNLPYSLWEKIQHIASFMEDFPPDTEFEYKVWPKGTTEPEMPGIPEVEG